MKKLISILSLVVLITTGCSLGSLVGNNQFGATTNSPTNYAKVNGANTWTATNTFSGVNYGVNKFQFFGDGSDGATTTSTTTLGRDYYFTNLTVATGTTLNTGGYRVFVSGTLINNGTISNSNNSVVGTVGAGGAGGAGGATSGNPGNGGAGGGVLFLSARIISVEGNIFSKGGDGVTGTGSAGGTNVGGVGGNSANSLTAANGGNGGNGSSGGTVTVVSKVSENNPYTLLQAQSVGGPILGGAGGSGGRASTAGTSGGGGGGGGVILYFYESTTGTGTFSVSGGLGGGHSGTEADGTAGSAGKIIKLQIK